MSGDPVCAAARDGGNEAPAISAVPAARTSTARRIPREQPVTDYPPGFLGTVPGA